MEQSFKVESGDFTKAGAVSSTVKRTLKQLGLDSKIIKRVVVALFEAEVNVIAHSYGGTIDFSIDTSCITLFITDTGPGIPDLDKAMQEGWSTATEQIREMGYGAGMRLPNMKNNADRLDIYTKEGDHTEIKMVFNI